MSYLDRALPREVWLFALYQIDKTKNTKTFLRTFISTDDTPTILVGQKTELLGSVKITDSGKIYEHETGGISELLSGAAEIFSENCVEKGHIIKILKK